MTGIIIPQPELGSLEDWARSITEVLQKAIDNGDITVGSGGALSGLTIYDSKGRVMLNPDGLWIYDAFGSNPISPDIVTIDTAQLVDAAITTNKIATSAVNTDKLADLSVEAAKLADSSVTSTKIANAAVGSAAIATAAIGTAHIANAAITSALINDAAIVTAKIADLAVDNSKIANATIDSAKIASLAADKIIAGIIATAGIYLGSTRFHLDGANEIIEIKDAQGSPVTRVKLGKLNTGSTDYGIEVYDSSGVLIFGSGRDFDSSIVDIANTTNAGAFATLDQITAANISTYIASVAIGTAYIANAAITTAKIADANITTAKILDANITTAKIIDGAITNAKIGNLAVDTAQINSAAITQAKIANAAVDTLQLAGQAVTLPNGAYTAASTTVGSSSDTTVQTITFTATGAPVAIFWSLALDIGDTDGGNITIRVKRNGTTLTTTYERVSSSAVSAQSQATGVFYDTPSAGSVTYTVTGAGNAVNGVSERVMVTMELKR